jgi:hypothetical protein
MPAETVVLLCLSCDRETSPACHAPETFSAPSESAAWDLAISAGWRASRASSSVVCPACVPDLLLSALPPCAA